MPTKLWCRRIWQRPAPGQAIRLDWRCAACKRSMPVQQNASLRVPSLTRRSEARCGSRSAFRVHLQWTAVRRSCNGASPRVHTIVRGDVDLLYELEYGGEVCVLCRVPALPHHALHLGRHLPPQLPQVRVPRSLCAGQTPPLIAAAFAPWCRSCGISAPQSDTTVSATKGPLC